MRLWEKIKYGWETILDISAAYDSRFYQGSENYKPLRFGDFIEGPSEKYLELHYQLKKDEERHNINGETIKQILSKKKN